MRCNKMSLAMQIPQVSWVKHSIMGSNKIIHSLLQQITCNM
uniref:Uncharacterized protein n=1 Tax=Anguilla anguilla TaxID=7936 RepID=A0A0E9WFD8_ANGAN